MKHPKPGVDYDQTSVESITYYATQLEDSSLREQLEIPSDMKHERKGKGGFGESVEYYYFGYDPNPRDEPDFNEAGLELKVTPLKIVHGNTMVPKERLVITKINYFKVVEETFESSRLYHKISKILLMHYLHDSEADPFDYRFKLVHVWEVPAEDYPTIKADWETIVDKVKSGLAHEISGGDTNFLEACTKAADSSQTTLQPFSKIPAKPRAFALKASYMRAVVDSGLDAKSIRREAAEENLGLEDLVKSRFSSYIGLTSEQLAARFELNIKAKGFFASVTNRILGLSEKDKVLDFEKAGLKVKTIRLKQNSVPKEDISFKAMDYQEVVTQDWEESDFYQDLTSRFLFVVYRIQKEDDIEVTRLERVSFWTMPAADLDGEAKRCFEETVARIADGRAYELPKKSENRCVHVRPHGRNKEDTRETPQGVQVTKKCFWLNASYIAEQLRQLQDSPKNDG